ncbi:hypothetical protein [Streptomyces sp. NPDC001978]|uniref:hypothetical protein n=1 Tax=Streptomyces sp. NPDC001978 TaxID=3364627 RepID=UPI0036CD77B5
MKCLSAISALACVFLLAGCSSSPTASVVAPPSASVPSAAMRAWYQKSGEMDVNVLTMDITGLKSAGSSGGSVTSACFGIGDDVKAVQSHAPIPDADWETAWESALTAMHNGYQDCTGGLRGNNTSEITKGEAEIKSAAAALTAVTKEFGS